MCERQLLRTRRLCDAKHPPVAQIRALWTNKTLPLCPFLRLTLFLQASETARTTQTTHKRAHKRTLLKSAFVRRARLYNLLQSFVVDIFIRPRHLDVNKTTTSTQKELTNAKHDYCSTFHLHHINIQHKKRKWIQKNKDETELLTKANHF